MSPVKIFCKSIEYNNYLKLVNSRKKKEPPITNIKNGTPYLADLLRYNFRISI